jgi:mannose-1-phosphate guanylyltransferase/mannose-6-phosphate isomerase
MNIIPVILSGGSGTRLWPLSRPSRPKQFMAITGDQTLFQMTLARLMGLSGVCMPIVVANEEHRFLAAEQCQEIGIRPASLILEPCPRNTAPAIGLAALAAIASARQAGLGDGTDEAVQDPILLVLPSDHVITDTAAFHRAILWGADSAASGELVTFGVIPTRPETGYGYVKSLAGSFASGARAVEQFVEKPDFQTAREYVASGNYFWNAGMFMFKASVYLQELRKHAPQIFSACERAFVQARHDLDFIRVDEVAFQSCPADSIDYAVMEKTDRASLVPLDAGWSDVGAWSAVWELGGGDTDGNVMQGDVTVIESTGCLVRSEHRLVGLVGVQDLIVVETADAVLVADRSAAQEVKQLVDVLKVQEKAQASSHRQVLRPWGSFDSIDHGDRYQVKRLTIKPGGKLSLQLHHHRAEHWVVVKGTAKVTIGESERLISENESVFIPLGVKHRLENPGSTPLEIIEVQSGGYLGEDDIVRFGDLYGRV